MEQQQQSAAVTDTETDTKGGKNQIDDKYIEYEEDLKLGKMIFIYYFLHYSIFHIEYMHVR